jgi:hypothetical protein
LRRIGVAQIAGTDFLQRVMTAMAVTLRSCELLAMFREFEAFAKWKPGYVFRSAGAAGFCLLPSCQRSADPPR